MLQGLMGPALVVVADVLSQHPAQMRFVEDDDPIQTFLPQAADPVVSL
jgi:hypothetical protein